MYSSPRIVVTLLLAASLWVSLVTGAPAQEQTPLGQASVRRIKVLGGKDAVEIEVEGSDRLVPQTRVLTGPDRLVIDFPNAVPGNEMRNQSVDRGEVKDVRFGLFQSKPPVTRIVLDLKTAQSFQVFPYGRTVMIKVVGGAPAVGAASNAPPVPQARPGLVAANYTPVAAPIQVVEAPPQPILEVSFRDGLLAIKSNKATLSDVLSAVQQRTGAQVALAPGTDQERVVIDLGPAPAADVLGQLLNGSKFNFLILSAANDPRRLDRVILSSRSDGGAAFMPLPQIRNDNAPANASASDDDSNLPPSAQPDSGSQDVPPPQPETKTPDNNTPDQ
jgi:hypothetical protein